MCFNDKVNKLTMKLIKGQILLITLLVLTILSIATVSIVLLNTRDVSQVQNSQQYNQIYNSIENEIKGLVQAFGKAEISLNPLNTTPYSCLENIPGESYKCNLNLVSGNLNLTAELNITDEKKYEKFQIFKDRSLEINLDGYKDDLDIYWENPNLPLADQASLEFILIYRDASGEFKSLIDIYNVAGVYTSPITVSSNPFVFLENPLYPGNQFARRLDFSTTLIATDKPEKLVIIPRMKRINSSIEIDILPTINSTYPNQIRKFVGKSVISNDPNSPVVNVITQIPLYPQTLSVLDYAILTNGEITLN